MENQKDCSSTAPSSLCPGSSCCNHPVQEARGSVFVPSWELWSDQRPLYQVRMKNCLKKEIIKDGQFQNKIF